MGIKTGIEWCDSTLNPEIGCDGCELWQDKTCLHCGQPIELIKETESYRHKIIEPEDGHEAKPVRTCYAGGLVSRYHGQPGYPESFDQPKLFLDRILKLESWRDLTGTIRPDKPWLNGLPRLVFLNDLGDTFTESLPLDWLGQDCTELYGRSPLKVLANCKAIIMLLTKRATRMQQFFELYPCPDNFIPMVSVTGPENLGRVRELLRIKARWHGVSAEPLLKATLLDQYLERLSLVITGGESGKGRRPSELEAFRGLRDRCLRLGVPFLMKQIDKVTSIPEDLLIRQMPPFTIRKQESFAYA